MLSNFLIFLVKMDDRIVIFINIAVISSLSLNFWKNRTILITGNGYGQESLNFGVVWVLIFETESENFLNFIKYNI